MEFKLDNFVKSRIFPFFWIPAFAGMTIIQLISDRYHRRHTREGGYPVFKTTFYDSIKLVSKREGQRAAFFPQPKDRVSDHIRIEERSIALHRAIADRIRTNPRLMEKARENLQKYLEQFAQENRTAPKSLTEWQDILTHRPGEAVLEFLVSSGESAAD